MCLRYTPFGVGGGCSSSERWGAMYFIAKRSRSLFDHQNSFLGLKMINRSSVSKWDGSVFIGNLHSVDGPDNSWQQQDAMMGKWKTDKLSFSQMNTLDELLPSLLHLQFLCFILETCHLNDLSQGVFVLVCVCVTVCGMGQGRIQ